MAPGRYNNTYHFLTFLFLQLIGQNYANIRFSRVRLLRRRVHPDYYPGEVKFCSKCQTTPDAPLLAPPCLKPERTHHCKTCQMCVGRMDHHCNFVGKCIGASNYKSFFIFVGSVVGLMTVTIRQTILTFWLLVQLAREAQGSLPTVLLYSAAYAFISTFLLFYFLLIVFSGRHLFLMAHGLTSIEDSFGISTYQPPFGKLCCLKQSLGGFWGIPLASFGDKWESFFQLFPGQDPEVIHLLEADPDLSVHQNETLGHLILRFPG